ncbi:hypothetical protein O3Q52_18355 [Streptomyces sp. ActVer]|uniref:Clp protease N-terminal domain-containing protein n=1 Tax=Streptomyces sp. ActVer TaxID=3014558 RepID=UPI0022B3DCDF|nr:Clp protease N-terminal domain-containing protein [Streptomyces sp. ActVer]MCZ4510117.1 hypothetical protein [Streptomyces sp. ActVer]
MDQRPTTDAHTDADADFGAGAGGGATTEFESDVMNLLVEALRVAVRHESPAVGTDLVLAALVMGDSDAGEAIAPGMRKAGSLSGMISGMAGRGWVSDDGEGGAPVTTTAPDRNADEDEVISVWREAQWRLALGSRGSASESGRELPGMTGALRACLLLALKSARAEGTVAVRCRHVARALLDLPDSRAREALVLRRLDTVAAATALDALDTSASTETERPESPGVKLLRRAGTLGKSGNRLTRALVSWTSGSAVNGSPVMFTVHLEAVRQAVRCGRTVAEPVDLLLGALALDRALSLAGLCLPEDLATVNSAAALLRRHGVRQDSLTRAAMTRTANASRSVGDTTDVQLSASADRAMAVARLSAAEQGSPTVGTVHLLAALLADGPATTGTAAATDEDTEGGAVVRLLTAAQVDVAALRAEPLLRPRA